MTKIKIVNVSKISSYSLQRLDFFKYMQVKDLNKLLNRIEGKLNTQLKKELRQGKDIEKIKSISVKYIKSYHNFKYDSEIMNKFYQSLVDSNITIDEEYYNDMTPMAMIINCFAKSDFYATPMCDVTLDLEKTLKKQKPKIAFVRK